MSSSTYFVKSTEDEIFSRVASGKRSEKTIVSEVNLENIGF